MSDTPDPELLAEIRRLRDMGVSDDVLGPAALRAFTRRADGTFPTLADDTTAVVANPSSTSLTDGLAGPTTTPIADDRGGRQR